MTNEIREVREAIERDLATARPCPEERTVESSPCGRYELELSHHATAALPGYPSIAVASIRDAATGEAVAIVRRNDDSDFHAWVTLDGRDYFLFAEDLEGQSVVDLATGRVEGFSIKDGFIWTGFHPSPGGSRLAILGCYWACPYEVAVYDFREPLNLPLPVLARFDLPGNDATFGAWTSDDSFTVVDREGGVRVFDLQGRPADPTGPQPPGDEDR